MLLVDAGNSRIKWRIVEGRALLAAGAVPTDNVVDLAAAWQPYRLRGAVLSCVANAAVTASLAKWLAENGVTVQWLIPEREKYGLINHYHEPAQLGSDRYAALIAALHMKLGDCVVVSVGTATTVDWLDRKGEFIGGVILPGPDLMRSSLLRGTGQIESRMQLAKPKLNFDVNLNLLPCDTDTAVGMGIELAQVGVIKAMLTAKRMGSSDAGNALPLLVLTGGARDKVRAGLPMPLIEIDDLVLEGLAWIALETASARC